MTYILSLVATHTSPIEVILDKSSTGPVHILRARPVIGDTSAMVLDDKPDAKRETEQSESAV